jgi:hypothetical protein
MSEQIDRYCRYDSYYVNSGDISICLMEPRVVVVCTNQGYSPITLLALGCDETSLTVQEIAANKHNNTPP